MVAAAERLNTTQSNLSKRILEMEQRLAVEVFDRSRRKIKLTWKGRELLRHSEMILRQHHTLIRSCRSESAFEGDFRLGVLESVGLTWLPRLIAEVRSRYTGMRPHPEITTSENLLARLRDLQIDLAIVTDAGNLTNDVRTRELARLELGLFGAPKRVDVLRDLRIRDLGYLPIIGHSRHSGMQRTLDAFFRRQDIHIEPLIASNSLSTTIHLAASGIGFVFIPKGIAFPDIARGLIRPIPMAEALPSVRYVAAYRRDDLTEISHEIAGIAAGACDFNTRY